MLFLAHIVFLLSTPDHVLQVITSAENNPKIITIFFKGPAPKQNYPIEKKKQKQTKKRKPARTHTHTHTHTHLMPGDRMGYKARHQTLEEKTSNLQSKK